MSVAKKDKMAVTIGEFVVLSTLLRKQEGLAAPDLILELRGLLENLSDRKGEKYHPSPGFFYPLLERLTDTYLDTNGENGRDKRYFLKKDKRSQLKRELGEVVGVLNNLADYIESVL